MDTDPGAGPAFDRDLVSAIAAELAARRESFIDNLVEVTRLEVEGLDHADELARWLEASIAENTALLIEILRDGDDPRQAQVPVGAVGYAVRLARANVPMSALLRAYRFGQAMFTKLCMDVATDLDARDLTVMREVVDAVAEFLDHVCLVVAQAYDDEAERVGRTPGGVRQQWVTQLLEDDRADPAEAEAALGYPLGRRHVAAEIWTATPDERPIAEILDRLTALVSEQLGGAASLPVPLGDGHARAWFALGGDSEPDASALETALRDAGYEVEIALGLPLPDISGFRRSHLQALRTRQLAARVTDRVPAVTSYAEVAAVALLREDPVELGEFVQRTLGALAADDDRTRGLRETLRVFLDANRMHDRAARRLQVHRNTVRYRVDQAVAARGRSLDTDPLDLMLALAAAHWLGPELAS